MLKPIFRTALVVAVVLAGIFIGMQDVTAKEAAKRDVIEQQSPTESKPKPEENGGVKTPSQDAVTMTCDEDACEAVCHGIGRPCGHCNDHGACVCVVCP
jgi:cell division protein FtsN